ncbi:MAG: hypothetical protein RQ885_02035 [Desulfurococcales archaeon]|jgi:hypothetical protein|nr:hypothetical protein [Desulfurococcales archaeon]
MNGEEAGLVYSLLLSIFYRVILRILERKLSSVKGFLAAYIIAVYMPIIAYLSNVSIYIGIFFFLIWTTAMILVGVPKELTLHRTLANKVGVLDLVMIIPAVSSLILILMQLKP